MTRHINPISIWKRIKIQRIKAYVVFFSLLCCGSSIKGQQGFKPACKLPFDAIKVSNLVIDKTCPAEGKATKTKPIENAAQNMVKNNFCATEILGVLKVEDFVKKHEAVMEKGVSFGGASRVPSDRSYLKELGEGKIVSFIGYIDTVKYSNTHEGESVNCKKKGAANNDLHMELTDKKNQSDKCQRISAEISPHFRPASWELKHLSVINERVLKIKVTGQLFFDASHGACPDSDSGYRASSWEIHPVYGIEIYVNKQWIDLHEWVNQESEE